MQRRDGGPKSTLVFPVDSGRREEEAGDRQLEGMVASSLIVTFDRREEVCHWVKGGSEEIAASAAYLLLPCSQALTWERRQPL